jgi:hypothetical protein
MLVIHNTDPSDPLDHQAALAVARAEHAGVVVRWHHPPDAACGGCGSRALAASPAQRNRTCVACGRSNPPTALASPAA